MPHLPHWRKNFNGLRSLFRRRVSVHGKSMSGIPAPARAGARRRNRWKREILHFVQDDNKEACHSEPSEESLCAFSFRRRAWSDKVCGEIGAYKNSDEIHGSVERLAACLSHGRPNLAGRVRAVSQGGAAQRPGLILVAGNHLDKRDDRARCFYPGGPLKRYLRLGSLLDIFDQAVVPPGREVNRDFHGGKYNGPKRAAAIRGST